MSLLLLFGGSISDSIGFTAANSTVAAQGGGALAFTTANATASLTGSAVFPGAIQPRRELVWTYGIDAVQTGVIS